jgi:CheY-like chemotaxis protein
MSPDRGDVMTDWIDNCDIWSAARDSRTVALVGRYAHRHLHDATGAVADCRVVIVESTAHAYSKIKRALPDVIVMCLSSDDMDACQVLSMLALDCETSRIPVLTYVSRDADDSEDVHANALDHAVCSVCAIAIN